MFEMDLKHDYDLINAKFNKEFDRIKDKIIESIQETERVKIITDYEEFKKDKKDKKLKNKIIVNRLPKKEQTEQVTKDKQNSMKNMLHEISRIENEQIEYR